MSREVFLIFSHEHSAWWRANSRGYTNAIDDAGAYSDEESKQIVDGGNQFCEPDKPKEERIPVALAGAIIRVERSRLADRLSNLINGAFVTFAHHEAIK